MLLLVHPRSAVTSPTGRWDPDVDLYWRDETLIVHADLPGADPASVTATVDGDAVVLTAERRIAPDPHDRVMHAGRRWGEARLRITAGVPLDPARTVADYADGVLTVRAPAAAPATGVRIAVDGLSAGTSAEAAAAA